ncbi:MAG: Fe-S cluster assembly protein SufD [Proteobacteria bacterium]|nr:Fe-S cluster assembly protein SufD [Pseudomonadota bacterium]
MISTYPHWSEQSLRQAQPELRLQFLQNFFKQGFPQRNDENWRYLSLTPLLEQVFRSVRHQTEHNYPVEKYFIPDTYRLVFINGVLNSTYSSLSELAQRIFLKMEPEFSDREFAHFSSFYWLNGALTNQGCQLFIPENISLDHPIHLLFFSENASGTMFHPRNRVVLSTNSQATIIEEYAGIGAGPYFQNAVNQISLAANAQLNYYKIQKESLDSFHIANTLFELAHDSLVRSYHFALGASISRDDIIFNLNETGASCELYGFYFPKANQNIDFHTRVDHFSAHTLSSQYYKGMIDHQGHGVFNGKMIIHPNTQQVSAHQQNANLLLSESAAIDSKPELIVLADDVRCSHGASIGNLDQNAIFYLKTRGIPETMARTMLMQGFINDLLDKVPQSLLADHIHHAIAD